MPQIKDCLTAKSTKSTFVVFALDEMYHLTAASSVATATVEYSKYAKQKGCMPEKEYGGVCAYLEIYNHLERGVSNFLIFFVYGATRHSRGFQSR